MAGLIIDRGSEGIADLRNKITDSAQTLQDQFNKTEQALEIAKETWQGFNFSEFENGFNEDKEQIKPLKQIMETFSDEILYDFQKKLEIIEEHNWH